MHGMQFIGRFNQAEDVHNRQERISNFEAWLPAKPT